MGAAAAVGFGAAAAAAEAVVAVGVVVAGEAVDASAVVVTDVVVVTMVAEEAGRLAAGIWPDMTESGGAWLATAQETERKWGRRCCGGNSPYTSRYKPDWERKNKERER